MKDPILRDIREHITVMEAIAADQDLRAGIRQAADLILSAFRNGGRLYLFGCGGSAADAQHIAAEFVNKMHRMRAALPAVALTTDNSVLTAIGNDDSFDHVFSRQVEAFAGKDDIVVGISTSGTSPSVVNGLRAGRERGAETVLLTGGRGDEPGDAAGLVIRVPSASTPRIQEAHIAIAHIICTIVEEEAFYAGRR